METRKKTITWEITLPVKVVVENLEIDEFFIDGEWEEAFGCEAGKKIEDAVREKIPGWYRCEKHFKQFCKECQ